MIRIALLNFTLHSKKYPKYARATCIHQHVDTFFKLLPRELPLHK